MGKNRKCFLIIDGDFMNYNSFLAYASTNKREIKLYELFDEYLQTLSSSSYTTIKYYIEDFKKFIFNKNVFDVTVNDIQKYINYKKALNLKDTTIYRYYRLLKTIFNYAISHEYIDKNPCANVSVKHAHRSHIKNIDYSRKYIKKLLKLFRNTKLYYIVLVAVHTRYAKSRNSTIKKI